MDLIFKDLKPSDSGLRKNTCYHLNYTTMNASATGTEVLVAKENISELKFPKTDVLSNPADRIERQKRVNQAMTLGNTSKSKVRIVFEDAEGVKTVETTIWGVTDNNIILKRTTLIPINRIHQIKFY